MSYFLKKTKNRKGTYLQIYESTYDRARGYGTHRSVRALGYVHELEAQGIEDPIAHFRAEVEAMNEGGRGGRRSERRREIGDTTPCRVLGHFALRAVWAALGLEDDRDAPQAPPASANDPLHLLADLACARAVCPGPYAESCLDALPLLAGEPDYTADELRDALTRLGRERGRVVDGLNKRIERTWQRDTSRTYLVETDLCLGAEGEAVEGRHVLALLLDADLVPFGFDVRAEEVDEGAAREADVVARTLHAGDGCLHVLADALVSDGDDPTLDRDARGLAWERPTARVVLATSGEDVCDDEVAGACREARRIVAAFAACPPCPGPGLSPDAALGHVLVTYVALVLEGLLATRVLGGRFDVGEVVDFMRALQVVRVGEGRYVSVATRTAVGDALEEITGLPLNRFHLTASQCERIGSYVFGT